MTAATRFAWGAHHAGVEVFGDPVTVEWDGTARVRTRLLEAMLSHKPLVVYGPRGAGKTFAVARAAEFYVDNVNPDCAVVYLRIPSADRGRGLYQAVIQQLTGRKHPPGLTETDLLFELSAMVTETERIIVVDEAHRLSVRAQDAIQNLVDVPGTLATWVLLGAPDTKTNMIPELWSRKTAAVGFDRLDDETAAAVMAEVDRVFAKTKPELLKRINRVHARGEFRYWMDVLARVHAYREVIGKVIVDEHVPLLTQDL